MIEPLISFSDIFLNAEELRLLNSLSFSTDIEYSSALDRLIAQALVVENQSTLPNGCIVGSNTYRLSSRGADYKIYLKQTSKNQKLAIAATVFALLSCILSFKEEIFLFLKQLMQ